MREGQHCMIVPAGHVEDMEESQKTNLVVVIKAAAEERMV
jgi:hypothetical protein